MRMVGLVRSSLTGLFLLASSASAFAATDVEVWHSMTGVSADTFGALVQRFNSEQSAVHVNLIYKGNGADTVDAAVDAIKRNAQPDLVEVEDEQSEALFASKGVVKPMYEVLALVKSPDFNLFLPSSVSFMRDEKGKLLGFPYQASVPVLLYNRDAFIKVKLNPDAPPATWKDMQKMLLVLNDENKGYQCSYTTSEQSWIHIENMSTMHGETFATKDNGLEGSGSVLTFDDLLHVRHVALLETWSKAQLFKYYGPDHQGDAKFASGECATLTTGSDSIGDIVKAADFTVGVAPLPYYEEGSAQPLSTLVNGSGLVALEGKKPEEYRAIATFIAYLATPVAASEWTQKTGSLPLTSAALDASVKSNGYAKVPGFASIMREVTAIGGPGIRGERLPEFAKVRAINDQELETVWKGEKAPKQALDDAVREGNLAMHNAPPPVKIAPTPKAKAKAKKA